MSGSGRLALSSRLLVGAAEWHRRIIFKSEPSRWEASETDGRVELQESYKLAKLHQICVLKVFEVAAA